MRKYRPVYFLTGFIVFLLILPVAFGVPNLASGQQNVSVTYYLDTSGIVPQTTCSGSTSRNLLGTLDTTAPIPSNATLNDNASVWNTFCTTFPVAIGAPLTITSVNLTLFVCCGNKTRFSLFPQLIDNSTTPPTLLAGPGVPFQTLARGDSCQSASGVTAQIPVDANATLMSGQVLVLQFRFSGALNATLCTGKDIPLFTQNTLSAITIMGTPLVANTTSTTTTEETNSTTTTTNTSTSTFKTTSSSSQSSTSTSTSTSSESETAFTSNRNTTSISSTSTNATSLSSASTSSARSNRSGPFVLNLPNPVVLSGLIAALVVVATSVIALGGKRS